jgi:hypothetical protein
MGVCQQGRADENEEAEIDLEFRERQLDLERMEAEAAFQNQMRELELEERRVEIDHIRDPTPRANGGGVALVLLCMVVNILMALWVYADNRRRDAGYGIWIVITLLVGFFGALVYAVIRLGDMNAAQPAPTRSAAAKK